MVEGEEVIQASLMNNNLFYPEHTALITRCVGLQDCAYKQITNEQCDVCNNLTEFTEYIRQHFHQVSFISIQTDSFLPDGTYSTFEIIPPNLLSFAFTGQSMFEESLNAIPDDEDLIFIYRRVQERYRSAESKQYTPFHSLIDGGLIAGLACVPIDLETVEGIFQNTQTWPEYIRRIDQVLKDLDVPLNMRFNFFRYWLPSFIHSKASVPALWVWRL